jgi:hypothetical protein
VLNGTIRQTIRPGNKFIVGDRVGFFGWAGKPYRSPWINRCGPWTVTEVRNIYAYHDEIQHLCDNGERWPWGWIALDDIAAADGIAPPTGIALRDVLTAYHGPLTGQPFQIIRWETALSPVPTPTRREPPHPQRQQT